MPYPEREPELHLSHPITRTFAPVPKLRPMKEAPEEVEVLAWNEAGNWHQVRREGDVMRMRWNENYHQFLGQFAGWIPMPHGPNI
jgi:hypothetical protein